MANVVITSAKRNGDEVFLEGTVDGQAVRTTVWQSHLNTLTTKLQKSRFCAQQMKIAATILPERRTDVDVLATVDV
mgnify:CR=1 FL=1